MARVQGVWALCVAAAGLTACAEGVTSDAIDVRMPGVRGAPAGVDAGAQPAAAPPPAQRPAVYTGQPCMMGETAACSCSSGGEGTKVCRFDMRSPTKGTFSECMACVTPAPQSDDGPGDVSVRDAGAAGRPGSQDDSGSGGGGSGGSLEPTGGRSGSAGSGGTGGSGGTSPPPTRPAPSGSRCNPPCTQLCFPIGILPCCTLLGTCGCTWAPGAYCL